MMNFMTKTLAVAAVTLAMAVPASAQTLVDATRPVDVLGFAQGYGDARLDVDDYGDPMIIGDMEGITYTVSFYGCQNNIDCKTLLFHAGFTLPGLTDTTMGDWNRSQLYGRAFLDGEGDPAIEMTVNMFGGVSADNINDTFDWWRVVLDGFKDHIGW